MIKRILLLLMAWSFINTAIADLDNDQLTGDLLLQEADPSLKNRQVGDEKIMLRGDIEEEQQQLTPDALEQQFDKKPSVADKQIFNADENKIPKPSEEKAKAKSQYMEKPPSLRTSGQANPDGDSSGKKFLGVFEREKERNTDQLTPDPLLDGL